MLAQCAYNINHANNEIFVPDKKSLNKYVPVPNANGARALARVLSESLSRRQLLWLLKANGSEKNG